MSDLAIRNNGQLDPMTVAQVFRASGMFPDIQSEAAAATKIIIGRGLGIADFDAMSGLHIIKGKAVLAANLMAAAIKRSGKYDYRVVVSDDTVCTIDFYGGGEKIGSSSFSVEDAKRAGLSGDNWRKYTRAMLFARCISAGYKTHCPDALGAAPVYVEAHGETEIPDDPKPEPKAKAVSPAAMRSMSPAERSAETKRLLAPTRAEFDGQAAPPAPETITLINKPLARVNCTVTPELAEELGLPAAPADDTFVIPATARIAAVKTPKGEVWRVDIDGREQPIAVREPSIASGIEANLAFSEPTYCRLEHDGKRDIVVELVKAPKEVTQ
jgi:hypothetical protein